MERGRQTATSPLWSSRFTLTVTMTAVLAVVVLWPVLESPYLGDDVFLSQFPAALEQQGSTWWKATGESTRRWVRIAGRFYPVAMALSFGVHELLPDRAAYKAVQVVVVTTDVMLLVAFVAVQTRDRAAAILAGVLVVATLQTRIGPDAILAFALLLPVVVACVLGALLLLHRALVTGRLVWAVGGALIWTAALLGYETTYLLAPTLLIVATTTRSTQSTRRTRILALATYAYPTLVLGSYVAYLRATLAVDPGPGYTSSFAPGPFLSALGIQALAALPGTARLATNAPPLTVEWQHVAPGLLAALLAAAACLSIRRSAHERADWGLGLIGLLFWLGPSLVVAQSVYWQEELPRSWNGYISAYSSTFGVALVLTTLGLMVGRQPPVLRIAGAVAVASVAAFGTTAAAAQNDAVVYAIRPVFLYPREVFSKSIEAGIFKDVPDGAEVVADKRYAPSPWVNGCFIRAHGGPSVVVRLPTPMPIPGCAVVGEPAPDAWYLAYEASQEGSYGWIMLGQEGRRPLLFVRDIALSSGGSAVVVCPERVQAPTIKRGDNWSLLRLESDACLPEHLAVSIVTD